MSNNITKGTVLVVEDFQDTVDILRRLLERNDYSVVSALSLTEARKKLTETKADIVVLDINLPDGSGLDLLHEIREVDSDMPVIMLTAYSEIENAIRSLKEGVDDFIPKPFENNYLLHSIQNSLEKRKLKQRLKQAEKFRIFGELAAGVAHDFNNILSSLGAHIYIVKKKAKESNIELDAHISVMEIAIKDGTAMVQRLNSMGKQQENNYQLVDLSKLINDTVLMMKPIWHHEAKRRGKEITVSTQLSCDIIIRVNPVDIREVFTNLILNAVDAMPQGGEISISLEKDKEFARCVFSDSGIGMTEEILERIFDPFFTTKGHGTGLGLAISYSIVERHHGEMFCESFPGKGTKFIINLPIGDK